MNAFSRHALTFAIAFALGGALPAYAQHAGHAMPKSDGKETKEPQQAGTDTAKANDRSKPMQGMDHSAMDHSKMDHSQMQGMDHSTMDHASMDHAQGSAMPIDGGLRESIPTVTDADRAAAFPEVHAHHQHGTSIQSYWLADRMEFADADHGTAFAWEGLGWVGGDVQKLWLRSEGHGSDGKLERGDVEALYGRGISAWWDVVAGIRQDFGEGPSRSWAAVGVQGLSPYKFEMSATAYLGQSGRTAAKLEAEYDTLFTSRLILQWRAEASLHGKDDPQLRIGSGLSTVEAGLRLRYEITRQFAPYIGIEHSRAFGDTADFRRLAGEGSRDTSVVAGLRFWF